MSLGSDRLEDIKIWNWGQARVTDTQARQRNPEQGTAAPQEPEQPTAKDQTPRSIAQRIKRLNAAAVPSLPVHKSLLHALRFALFGSRFDSKTDFSDLFNHLEGIAWGYTRYLIHVFDMKKLFQTGRPNSHVFLDVIASVTFMKDLAKMDGPSSRETELARFWAERQTFWKGKLGSSDICYLNVLLEKADNAWTTTNWKKFSEVLEAQCTIIYDEVRNMLLLDPTMNFQAKAPEVQERQVDLSRIPTLLRLPVLRRLVSSVTWRQSQTAAGTPNQRNGDTRNFPFSERGEEAKSVEKVLSCVLLYPIIFVAISSLPQASRREKSK